MDYNNFISYFDRFIKPYLPFKNNKTYQSFCSLLKDNYFKDSYLNIPEHLATYVEDQKINIELYSKLLIGNGYPEDLVNQLSTAEKETLIDKFMHYQAKSGTLAHFKQICNEFGDNFNVYELYADYRKCTVNAKITMDWVMAPKPIYKYNTATPTTYDYDEIYNATPTYFLSKLQLELWRKGKSITLPFKTNLMVLDWQNVDTFSMLDGVISMATLSYFQNVQVAIEINNVSYILTLATLYQLWNYLCSYITSDTSFNASFKCVSVSISDNFPYSLDPNMPNSIDILIAKYNAITDRESFDEFWKTSIEDKFTKYISGNGLTTKDLRKKLIGSTSAVLLSYFEDMINGAQSKIAGLYSTLSILDDAVNKFLESTDDELAIKYQDHLKMLMVKPVTDPTSTTTYKLLNTFKPYHTQFITLAKFQTTSKDSTNKFYSKDKVYFVNHNWESSAVVISDYFTIQKSYYNDYPLTNGQNYMVVPCPTLYSVKVGDYISFSQSYNTQSACSSMQIINIERTNITTDQSRLDLISKKIRIVQYSLIDDIKDKLLNAYDENVFDIITQLNDNNNTFLEICEVKLNEISTDTIVNYNALIDFINSYNDISIRLKNDFSNNVTNLYNTNDLSINIDQIKYLISTLKIKYIFTSSELKSISTILSADDICTVYFDRIWMCPTDTYNRMTIINMPPVDDTISIPGAEFTFTNIKTAKYIHTNEVGILAVGIGDYIYVISDTHEYAVKVIGKDLTELNLLIDKSYLGTAGTFTTIGRYRPG